MSNRADRFRELLDNVADRERCSRVAGTLDAMGMFVDACNVLTQMYCHEAVISDLQMRLAVSWESLVEDPDQFLQDALDGLPAPPLLTTTKRRRSPSATWQRDLAAGAAVA